MSTIQPIFSDKPPKLKLGSGLIGFLLLSVAIHLAPLLSNQAPVLTDHGGGSALQIHMITSHSEVTTPSKTVEQSAPTIHNKAGYIPKLMALKNSATQTDSSHKMNPQMGEPQKTDSIQTARKRATPRHLSSPIKTNRSIDPIPDNQPTQAKDMAMAQERKALSHKLQQALTRYFSYPSIARRRGWQGTVILAFNLGRNGNIVDIRIASSSGHTMLDNAALTTLEKIDRIEIAQQFSHSFELPVIYQLQGG